MTTRILVADDHPLFRDALKLAVSRVSPDCELVEASNVEQALQHLQKMPNLSLVLLDLKMPDCSGVEGLVSLRARFPGAAVAVVSGCDDPRQVHKALALGACGYIPKSVSMEALVAALETILSGEIWAPASAAVEPSAERSMRRLGGFTPAEVRILMDLQRGRLNKQIASDIGVSEATVKSHLTSIFRKLGVVNRTQAVLAVQSLMDSAA